MAPGHGAEIVEFIQALTLPDSHQKLILSGVSFFGPCIFALLRPLLRHDYDPLFFIRIH